MPLLPYAEYKPDVSDYEGTATKNILNVVPRGDGYGPFPSFSAYTSALPSTCRGAFYALKSDGTVITFAGTDNKLYKLNNTDYGWADVSSGGSSYSALSSSAQWQFAQTGNLVFATQANAPLQVFDLTASNAFANAQGLPPQAAYISVVGRFLVLSGLLSTPYRIQWCGLNNFNSSTSWDNLTAGADFQDFPDGGIVRGVAGGEAGIIFQDLAIRRMSYVPGSPIIFQIDRITQDKGLFAPYSIIRAGERIFFYAGQGFHKIEPGGVPEQIGRERIDRTFLDDLDKGNLQLFMGAADPRSTRVYWAYKSVNGTAGCYDKLLGYDFLLDRFFPVQMTGEYLLGISQTGLTLENLDSLGPGALAVTGAADNGSGLVRLTVASTATLITGQIASVSGVVGTVEANGERWVIAVIDGTHLDLQGAIFANAYVSGGIIGGSIDAMTLSLDAYPTAVQPEIAQFSSSHVLGFFRGTSLEAIMESSEQGTDDERITIRGFCPITDAASLYGSASYRDTPSAAAIAGNEVSVNARTGRCDVRRDTRYSRFRVRIPAATSWTFCAGVVPDLTPGGTL
ncbi:hypothetical protein [Bradyrhizobium sp. Tv2a-2]|uniref:hypothetical protein n=1 Tax=Bradyrhizobium sp. Tv2a-2 TaxID=113395 RepID=UPI000464A886|nr:hypothetical protein [Bradyrhizobium sp. Tv2a-2]